MVWRQPFPGPGLAIRIMCADKPFIDPAFDKTNAVLDWVLNKSPETSDVTDELRKTKSYISVTSIPFLSVTQ